MVSITLHRQIQRVGRIELAAHRRSVCPFRRRSANLRQHLFSNGLEAMGVLTIGVNFHQLQSNGLALRMLLQCLAQDFFGLHVATVGDVDIGLCDRVDFIALVAAANAEIRTEHAVLRGVDALTAGRTEQRVGTRHHSAFL